MLNILFSAQPPRWDEYETPLNAALTKAREYVDAEVEKITGGLAIPGLG